MSSKQYVRSNSRRATKTCEVCQQPFIIPACYVSRLHTCSPACAKQLAAHRRAAKIAQRDGSKVDVTAPSYKSAKRVERACIICGTVFLITPKAIRKTCSDRCDSQHRSIIRTVYQPVSQTCEHCGQEFTHEGWHADRKRRFCSNPCRMAALNALPRQRLEGFHSANITPKGYVRGWVWESERKRQVMEHVWVVEQRIGRRLTASERVHHKNGDRADNVDENLVLYPDQATHLREAHPNMARQTAERRRARLQPEA